MEIASQGAVESPPSDTPAIKSIYLEVLERPIPRTYNPAIAHDHSLPMGNAPVNRADFSALFKHASREARIVLAVWFLALVWTVGCCWVRGYPHPADSWLVRTGLAPADPAAALDPIWGLPSWVCYGIVLPWIACTLFTLLFCVAFMRDDPLGADQDEEAARGT